MEVIEALTAEMCEYEGARVECVLRALVEHCEGLGPALRRVVHEVHESGDRLHVITLDGREVWRGWWEEITWTKPRTSPIRWRETYAAGGPSELRASEDPKLERVR